MVIEILLCTAFMKVAEKLAEKAIIDPALEKGFEPFTKWLTKDYDAAKSAQELRKKFDIALSLMRR